MMKDLDKSSTRKNGRRELPQPTVTRAVTTTIEPPRQVNPIKNMEARYRWSPTSPVKNATNLIKNENKLTLKCQENVWKDCWREKIEEEQNQVATVNLVYNSFPSWHDFLHDKFHSSIPSHIYMRASSRLNCGHIYREKQENSRTRRINSHRHTFLLKSLESERQTDDSLTIFPLSILRETWWYQFHVDLLTMHNSHRILCSLSSFQYGRVLL